MLDTLKKELPGAWAAGWSIIQSRLRFGHNIFETDWDVLIVLDACRIDAIRKIADNFSFIDRVDSKWSRGSTSKEWLENTFIEKYRDEVAQTAYVTANSFAREMQWDKINRLDYVIASQSRLTENRTLERLVKDDQLSADDFLYFESLWDKMIGDTKYKEISPEIVTDRAIKVDNKIDCNRLIVHYMQPHHPFIYPNKLDDLHRNPFQYLGSKQGKNQVWNAYVKNLKFVSEYVEILLNNIDAQKVIITSDHGELFGRYLKTHPVGVLHPDLRRVPWITTSATDRNTHEPSEYDINDNLNEDEIKSRLSDLGYL